MSNAMAWSTILSSLRRIKIAWIVGVVQATATLALATLSALGWSPFLHDASDRGGTTLDEVSERLMAEAVTNAVNSATRGNDWVYEYLAFLVIAGLSYGIYRRSKIAIIVMVALELFNVLAQLSERSWIGVVTSIGFVVVFVLAAQAVFRLERASRELGVDPKVVQPKDAMTRRRVLYAAERVQSN